MQRSSADLSVLRNGDWSDRYLQEAPLQCLLFDFVPTKKEFRGTHDKIKISVNNTTNERMMNNEN